MWRSGGGETEMAAAVKGWREPREERERRIALSALPFEEEASFFPRFARSSLSPLSPPACQSPAVGGGTNGGKREKS